jgi:hypothetical protein
MPIVVAPVGPAFSVHTASIRTHAWASGGTRDRRLCVFTLLAVLLALTSILYNPLGACSALALVCGFVGVVRPGATGGWRVLARSASASAIVVSVATAAVAASTQFHLF